MNKDHEEIRKELWCNVWVAVAGASNSTRSDIVTTWADRALKDFDERFPRQNDKEHER
jgi:hypothetical protein